MISLLKCWFSDIHIGIFGKKGKLAPVYSSTAMVIQDDLDDQIIQKIKNKVDEIIEKKENKRLWVDDFSADHRILGFEKDMPELVDILRIEDRLTSVEEYLGRKIGSWFLMANKIVPVEGNLGSGGGVHRDSPYSHQIKHIWYLTDVNEDNGPFQYVEGSHRDAPATARKYPLGQARFEDFYSEYNTVCAPAGSLLICDTKCLHRGAPISTGSRYALTLYTSPNPDAKKGRVVKLDD